MPRFAANLTMLFNEVPFLERFESAARAGFDAVEFLFPYEHDPQVIRRLLDDNGLELVLHNLPAGDWAQGERGIACDPKREAEFREGVARAVGYALELGVPQLNCLAGKKPEDVPADVARRTLLTNLRYAADKLREVGVKLLVEPINTFDIPDFFLHNTRQAIALMDDVDSDNLWLQYDIYHAQRMEGEIANTLTRYLPRIAHVQLADNPGRGEPGTGEINYGFLFRHLDRIGYEGWVGCEYKPTMRTEDTFEWREAVAGGVRGPHPTEELEET